MIGISSTLFDIDGSITFQTISSDSATRNISRRVSRRATLDGSVVVTDNGFSEGDRDFIIILKRIKREHSDKLQRLFKLYSILHLSTDQGFYKVAPESFDQNNDQVTLRFLAVELLSS